MIRLVERNLKIAVPAIHGNRAAITASFHDFDAGRGASGEKRQHARPVVGWAETEAEEIFVFQMDRGLVREASYLSRRAMVDLADAGVESAYATETRSEGNLTHRETGLVDELLRKVQTARLSYGQRCRAQVLKEQAAKMARADAQAFGKNFYTTVFQAAFADQPQSSRNGVWSSQPRRSSRRALRPATQAGTKASVRGGSGSQKVTAVFLFCRTGGADRAAIDAAGAHADKELAVKARIARQPGPRTHLPIQIHISRDLMIADP